MKNNLELVGNFDVNDHQIIIAFNEVREKRQEKLTFHHPVKT